jgi:hypothetical protein
MRAVVGLGAVMALLTVVPSAEAYRSPTTRSTARRMGTPDGFAVRMTMTALGTSAAAHLVRPLPFGWPVRDAHDQPARGALAARGDAHAPEIPGNGIDDDCGGGDQPGKVVAIVRATWLANRSRRRSACRTRSPRSRVT